MKILLIGFSKIKYMPYANFYLENINKQNHEVHLLYWNRDLIPENTDGFDDITLHEFRCYQEDNVPPISKIGSFLKFRKYARKILKQERFDFVIILHSLPGILLSNIWIKKYRNKYIFDYRDSTYERFELYRKRIVKLIESSRFSFTSSDGFRKFWGENCQKKVYTSHNILTMSLSHRTFEKNPHNRIRVSFWGFVREGNLNMEIIRKFAKDERFEVHYYGREQRTVHILKDYAMSLSAENIYFHGEYAPEDRYEFVKNTDLIHNIYCHDNMMLAMSNKYYDGAIFYIPQLCMVGSHMGKQCQQGDIGLICDPFDENFTQKVYDYYIGLNKEGFVRNCDLELDRVMKQYQDGVEKLQFIFG